MDTPANASLLILQSVAASALSATVCKYNSTPIGAALSISAVVLPLVVEVFAPLPEAFASLPRPLAITSPLSWLLPSPFGVLPPSKDVVYVNAPDLVAVPPAVVTATLLAPTVPAGVLAVIEVALTTTTFVADVTPIFTLVAPVKFVPVMVIVVPPVVGPDVGVTLLIVGSRTMYVNALVLVAVPPAVVTATLLAPAVPAGVLAVTEVLDTTTMFVAAMPPTVTLVAPVKLVPAIVMVVPPVVGPEVGLTLLMVGSGTM